ncbi:PatB family C-S lyase [Algivirga pacifica]|uniref:cysteine-S-conjugate beta-lyase n=1 Tax=Algivirga pacifica TaxID=1162670 RepID=A0ABP9DGP2_9BACT
MPYNFDSPVSRKDTDTVKYDLCELLFGSREVIPLWVADMDLPIAKEIQDALVQRASHPVYGYTIQSKRCWSAVQGWLQQQHQWEVPDHSFVFSPGIVPALTLMVQAFTQPKEKVMIFTPVYTPFHEAVKGNDRTLITNDLVEKNGRYEIDFQKTEELLKEGVKLLIFCNPHNPSGRMWTKEEILQLLDLCKKYNTLIFSDEIHADLTFFGNKHIPFATIREDAAQQVITGMAPSKTFNLAGLQASYLIFLDDTLKRQYTKVASVPHLNFGGTFGTEGMIAAYTHGHTWYKEMKAYIQGNIEFVIDYIDKHIPEIKAMKPEATYLIWLDCKSLGLSDPELKKFMVEKAGIALNEGISFGQTGSGWQRMNVAVARPVLEKALAQLKEAMS